LDFFLFLLKKENNPFLPSESAFLSISCKSEIVKFSVVSLSNLPSFSNLSLIAGSPPTPAGLATPA
jgi:hypothetical protein